VLPHQYADDPQYRERFRREARKAASLNHRHIVTILEVGEVHGRLFVTMPVIDGRDLQSVLEDGPLAPERAVAIVEQVAAALAAAHKIGLVHRDIKPSNILLTEDDFAYLIDFGIARAAGDTTLTAYGVPIGTPAYMAPEQFRPGEIKPMADTYALTCVLYQCLTGQLPFPGDTFDPPPKASVHDPDTIPAAIDDVIATGMAKDPDQRYQSTTDLATAVRACMGTRREPEPPKSAPVALETSQPETAPQQAEAARTELPPTAADIATSPPRVTPSPLGQTTQARDEPPAPQPPPPAEPVLLTGIFGYAPPPGERQAGQTLNLPEDRRDGSAKLQRQARPWRRDPWGWAFLALLVALVVAGVIAGIITALADNSAPPSTTPTGAANTLDGLLLSTDEVNAAMGSIAMTSRWRRAIGTATHTVSPSQCRTGWDGCVTAC
jgi:serine/threonine protein kinase